MPKFDVIGRPMPKIDGNQLVTGKAKFTVDIQLPRMLYCQILRSPVAHARIKSIDTTEALKLPGVKAVITAEDTAKVPFGTVLKDQYPLAVDKVRYVGDEIAAVAATSERLARKALEFIKVEYEELPAVFDPEEAMKPGAPVIHGSCPDNTIVVKVEAGDIEKGFAMADHLFENRFSVPGVHHCTMEPQACVCDYDVNGKLTVWTSTSAPFLLPPYLASTLKMPVGKIRVIKPHVGGSFGSKSEMLPVHFCTALLSMKTDRPVKMVYDMEEQFMASRIRHPMIIYLKTGVKKDGTIIARQARVITDNGAYASYGPGVTYLAGALMASLYRVPNIRFTGHVVYTNKAIGGAFRGFGNPQITFATESEMDIIAEKLGLSPAEIRLKNAVRPGDNTPCGWKITSCGLEQCLKETVQRSDWEHKKGQRDYHGVGMAYMIHHIGWRVAPSDSSAATIKIQNDGQVVVLSGAADIGTGSDTVLAQIVAETMGIVLDKVTMVTGDTELTPMDFGSYASRVTTIAGNAVKAAAKDALEQIFAAVAPKLGVGKERLVAKNGFIFCNDDPEKCVSFGEAVYETQVLRGKVIIGTGTYDPPTENINPETGGGNLSVTYPFAAQVAEIAVDRDTGQVDVIKFTAAYDAGTVINPLTLEGQIDGGLHMGLGYALSEQMVWDNRGNLLNSNFADYKLLTATDLHGMQLERILVETHDPDGPFGAKGTGESVTVPTAPALANAIYDATGVRVKDLPITPEKLYWALKEKSN